MLEPGVVEALDGLEPGARVIVLTWLDRARPHACSACTRATTGPIRCEASSRTRSADRPNPIGLHEVEVLAVEGNRVQVSDLEALDGTPVLDLKPVLD